MKNEQADAEGDGQTCLARRDSQAWTETGKYIFLSSCPRQPYALYKMYGHIQIDYVRRDITSDVDYVYVVIIQRI